MRKNITPKSLLYKIYLFYDLYVHHLCLKKKKSYSQHREDLFLMDYFKDKSKGFYIDIGCYHPIKYSNTALLFQKGWNGINIDMNVASIDLFNIIRPNDINICASLSDKDENVFAYYDHFFSPINSLKEKFSDFASNNISFRKHKKYEVKTTTFDKIIKTKGISIPKIDFLNIDVEGVDLEVLQGFNLDKYKPELICIEMWDIDGTINEDKHVIFLNKYGYTLLKKLGPNGIFVLKK